jgi:DNA-binding MurR/RpiR family transcriptional regulator
MHAKVSEMKKNILSVIEEKKHQFSKGQRAISKYIIENYDKVTFMTAGKLGRAVGVSESTVVRFASKLGYDGYPSMRKALQELIKNRLTSVQRIEVAKDMMSSQDVLSSVLHSDINKIKNTLEMADRESFDKAVDAILSARKIYIVALRSSAMLGSFMGFYFNLLFENVRVVTSASTSEIFEYLLKISKDDVVIGISFPRYSTLTVKAMKFCNDMGATVIGITDSDTSPLSKNSEISLLAKSDMLSFLDSLVAPLSIINALIVSVGTRTKENLSDTFRRLEHIWDEYEIYEKNEDIYGF